MKREESAINVRRGRCDSLDIYEVTEGELEILKKGSPNSIFLNFSIALLSLALSFLATLLTVKIESNRSFYVFVILTVIGFITGIVLLVLWVVGRNDFKETINKIEKRIENEEKKDVSMDDESIIINKQ